MIRKYVKNEVIDSDDFDSPVNVFLEVIFDVDVRLVVEYVSLRNPTHRKIVSDESVSLDDWKKYKKWVLKDMLKL